MSRPRKCRKVCHFPPEQVFLPEGCCEEKKVVTLTVDEYETIRLIDREGMSQEQCSESMNIARTTVQQIYACARKKLADMLVEGLPLRIGGGEYRLYDNSCEGSAGDDSTCESNAGGVNACEGNAGDDDGSCQDQETGAIRP